MCFSPQRRAILRYRRVLYILTSECASRHSGVQFCDIRTSKSGPKMTCFVHFHFQMYATAACNFATSELQKVVRKWGVLYIFTSKCGVQFFICLRNSYLRTRRFNRPTFRLTRHTNHWKNTAFRDFSNISRGCIFILLTFALLHLLSSDLTACLICFSTLHIVGSLVFKLPSTIKHWFAFASKPKQHHMSISSKKCLQDAESMWKAPEQAEALRRKVQEKSFPLELETIHLVMSYLLKREWNLERPKKWFVVQVWIFFFQGPFVNVKMPITQRGTDKDRLATCFMFGGRRHVSYLRISRMMTVTSN